MKLWSYILTIICTVIIIWGIGSTLEVAHKSLEPNPQYSAINLWSLVLNYDGGTQ